MTVSAKEVQELRKMSGAGMMECKSALSEANGNLDDACFFVATNKIFPPRDVTLSITFNASCII